MPTAGMRALLERALERSRENIQAREESFQRSDTDGFLTQWALGLNSVLERLRAEILGHGGFAVFPALYNRHTGERVDAVLREGQHGFYWMLLDDDGRPTGEFFGDTRTKRAKLWKSGYAVLGEWAPAKAYMAGKGYGLSGSAWPAVKRIDFDEREGADLAATDTEIAVGRYLAGEEVAVVLVDALRTEGEVTSEGWPSTWTDSERQALVEALAIADAFGLAA